MRNYIFLLFSYSLLTVSTNAQNPNESFDGKNWQAPYSLSSPKGWDVERFTLPPNFAPNIQYKGVEDIRFTPEWAKAKSEEYWSYAFLWYLDGLLQMNEKIIAANLKAYYSGLIKSNLDPKKIPTGGIMETKVLAKKTATISGDLETYIGKIEMLDYMAKKTIILNCLIHLRQYPNKNKTIIFYTLSPKPLSHSVWINLHKLWADFVFH